jgi:solute carrier family 34 (sodium-dependent phosphate cotransporter)
MAEPQDETDMPDDVVSSPDPAPTIVSEAPPAGPGASIAPVAAPRERSWLTIAGKSAFLVPALFLFVLAIQLMKEGAKAIGPTLTGSPLFSNAFSTLGAGWLGAYVVLSGSPVAAVALSLFVGGALTELQTFTMLSGSRLGAAFVVLLVGFLYAVRNRGHNRSESIGMGVLALALTAIVYVPGMFIGYGILKAGWLEDIRWHASSEVQSAVDYVWGPALDLLTELPGWTLLPVGLAIVLLSFRLLDRVLPQLDGERHGGRRAEWLKRPWPMFLLGCLVATVTLSVSVALTLLVPLASRGYVRRREAIPYIMGANITTLADTMVAAMVLGNAVAVQIVLAQALAVAVVSLVLLAVAYRPLVGAVMALDDWLVASNRRLWLFVAGLFVLPGILLTSGIWIGPIAR